VAFSGVTSDLNGLGALGASAVVPLLVLFNRHTASRHRIPPVPTCWFLFRNALGRRSLRKHGEKSSASGVLRMKGVPSGITMRPKVAMARRSGSEGGPPPFAIALSFPRSTACARSATNPERSLTNDNLDRLRPAHFYL